MASNTLKCNHLMPLPFKGLIESTRVKPETVGGSPAVRSLPLRLTKTISTDFDTSLHKSRRGAHAGSAHLICPRNLFYLIE